MIIPRAAGGLLQDMLKAFPVVAVVGARQVGKSTLVRVPEIGGNRAYQTLDDFAVLDMARRDPVGLVRQDALLTIDEVQRCPDLLLAVKREVDRRPGPGRYLLTGSADLDHTANLARILAGRVGVLALHPLSWREQERRQGEPALLAWMKATKAQQVVRSLQRWRACPFDSGIVCKGGYPPAVTAASARARQLWFESFRYTYLERDIRQVSEIGNLADFARLMEMSATRTAQILNQAALGRDLGMSAATLGRHLSLLEATFQIERLRPYFTNIGKRLVKSPKLYWRDTGVAAHLLGVEVWRPAAQSAEHAGPLFETFVMMEIRKMLASYARSARLYFLRTHGGLEVDGLIVDGQRILPFEIKAAATVRGEDAKALQLFLDQERRAAIGIVFYTGTDIQRLGRQVVALPVTALLA